MDAADELTPAELEELQKDIIKAIESFDMVYNSKAKPKPFKPPVKLKPAT